MQIILRIYTTLVIAVLAILPLVPAGADITPNLIVNPGAEISTADNSPDFWTANSWGSNNPVLTYSNNAHTGNRALTTTINNYIEGDAKWMFNPVNVLAGEQYVYSDWYQATVGTHLWAQYRHTSGNFSYQWLGSAGASSTWNQAAAKLTVPEGVNSLSVFHVLSDNGQLTIDDAGLTLQPVCSATITSGIYNGGFEETCTDSAGSPLAWHGQTYGNSAASFEYLNSGRSGNHAVQTTMTGNSGEAGWQSDWQAVTANQRYNLSFWHDGTAYVYAYVAITLNDGSLYYLSLMSVPATQNTGWSGYSDNFVTPANAKSIQINIATSSAGTFRLDDAGLSALTNYSSNEFSKGMVSVTFDDNDSSIYSNGYSTLKSYGLKATFYVNAATIDSRGYMTKSNLRTLAQNGQEVGSHLYNHTSIVTLNVSQLEQQITTNNNTLRQILGSNYQVNSFASPYGAYTSNALNTVMQRHQSHRTTDGRFNTKTNFNARQIHAVLVNSDTTTAQVKSWIDYARQSRAWLVLVYHGIGASAASGEGSGYTTTKANFQVEMSYLRSSGVTVLPVSTALSQLSLEY